MSAGQASKQNVFNPTEASTGRTDKQKCPLSEQCWPQIHDALQLFDTQPVETCGDNVLNRKTSNFYSNVEHWFHAWDKHGWIA